MRPKFAGNRTLNSRGQGLTDAATGLDGYYFQSINDLFISTTWTFRCGSVFGWLRRMRFRNDFDASSAFAEPRKNDCGCRHIAAFLFNLNPAGLFAPL